MVVNMQAGQERPTGWLGFYKERGENVSAIGSHPEVRNVLKCGWEWRCQPMPKRPPKWPEPWELCGYTWLCHWAQESVVIADTFAYSVRSLSMELVQIHSQYNRDFGYFDILECRTFGTFDTWFMVTTYWGFATKIGDNMYRI